MQDKTTAAARTIEARTSNAMERRSRAISDIIDALHGRHLGRRLLGVL
jgi:hypothetical protein